MLEDQRIRVLHDFPRASDCFPGVEIKGGVNYFLWDRDNPGLCLVCTHEGGEIISTSERFLKEDGLDMLVRDNNAIPIMKKVALKREASFASIVSANDPFGFDVREANSMTRIKPKMKLKSFDGSCAFYYNGWRKNGLAYVSEGDVRKNTELVDSIKLLVPKAVGSGETKSDLIKPLIPEDHSCCSETYIVIGPFDSANERDNCISYISTKFFHFMVGILKNTQECRRNVYSLVPLQNFSQKWTDDMLFEKYGLSEEEADYIKSSVRPMELDLSYA